MACGIRLGAPVSSGLWPWTGLVALPFLLTLAPFISTGLCAAVALAERLARASSSLSAFGHGLVAGSVAVTLRHVPVPYGGQGSHHFPQSGVSV